MSNEFEPYHTNKTNKEFSAWDYQGNNPVEEVVEVNLEEQLRNEIAVLKQEAIERGYVEGLQQAQEEINAKKNELTQWIALFQKPIQLLDEQLIQEVIQTMIWLSQHCIGIELTVHPEKLLALFEEIRAELPSLKGNKVLGMNPDDAEWIKAEISDKDLPGIEQILFADSSLTRGDFYLKGDHSDLDGRLKTRFTALFAKYINEGNLNISMQSKD